MKYTGNRNYRDYELISEETAAGTQLAKDKIKSEARIANYFFN